MSKAFTLALSLLSTPALADWQVNMNEGVTALSREIFDLHMLIFWICVVIGVAVFGVMFYSIFKHRKSKGAVAEHWHENTTVEVVLDRHPINHFDCDGRTSDRYLDGYVRYVRSGC